MTLMPYMPARAGAQSNAANVCRLGLSCAQASFASVRSLPAKARLQSGPHYAIEMSIDQEGMWRELCGRGVQWPVIANYRASTATDISSMRYKTTPRPEQPL